MLKFPQRTRLCQKLWLMSGLSPLPLSLVLGARMLDGHACLGHRRLLRLTTWLGWVVASLFHRVGNGVRGAGSYENLRNFFTRLAMKKLIT